MAENDEDFLSALRERGAKHAEIRKNQEQQAKRDAADRKAADRFFGVVVGPLMQRLAKESETTGYSLDYSPRSVDPDASAIFGSALSLPGPPSNDHRSQPSYVQVSWRSGSMATLQMRARGMSEYLAGYTNPGIPFSMSEAELETMLRKALTLLIRKDTPP